MPVWSLSQQRAAVGKLSAIAARHRYKQLHDNNEYRIQREIYIKKGLYLVFLLLSSLQCQVVKKTIEGPSVVEDAFTIQCQPLQHQEVQAKRKLRKLSSLSQNELSLFLTYLGVGLQLVIVFVSAVSAFLVELLLMQSGDVEPNPGPKRNLLTEEHFPQLVNDLHDIQNLWFEIGVQLGLKVGTLRSIESQKVSVSQSLSIMLHTWVNFKPMACWEDFVNALRSSDIGNERLAMQLRDKHCPQHKFESTGIEEPEDKKDQSIKAKYTNGISQAKSVKGKYEDDRTNVKEEEHFKAEEIESIVSEMDRSLNNMFMQIFHVMNCCDRSAKPFCCSLAAGLVGVQGNTIPFLPADWLPKLRTGTSPEHARGILQQHLLLTNYIKYGLLQHTISMYDNSDLKEDVRQYEQKQKTLQSLNRLPTFSQECPSKGSTPSASLAIAEIVVEIRKPWLETSLEELYSLQTMLSSHYSLPLFSLLLSHAHKSGGFTCVTFLTSPTLAKQLRVQASKEWFKEIGLLSLSVEGELIFQSALKQYSSHLRQLYSSREPQPLVHWIPPPNKELHFHLAQVQRKEVKKEDRFTISTLRGDEDDIRFQKCPMSLDDIGKLPEGRKAQLILLEGAPGVGKSTASLYLCKQHSQGKYLNDYIVLILLPLRDDLVLGAETWQDLLHYSDPEVKKALVQEIEATDGRGILFILDGWDELPIKQRTKSSIFLDLVTGSVLPEALVLVTCRPWASKRLREELKNRQSQHIELVGSSDQQVKECMQEERECSQQPKVDNRQQFISYISSNPVIKALMFTPATRQLIIAVFNTNPQSLPTTSTELYRQFTLLVLQHYLNNHPHYRSGSTALQDWSDLPAQVEQQFYGVCQMAFSGLEQGHQIVFSNLSSTFDSLGLMVAVHELYRARRGTVSHHFLHLSLQEFLAAIHISRLPADQQLDIVKKYFQKDNGTTLFKVPLHFLGGLTKPTTFPSETLRNFLRKDPVLLCQWMFESNQQTLLSALHFTGDVELYRKKELRNIEYFAIGYCIAHSNCTWKIEFCSSTDDMRMQYFIKGCCTNSQNGTGTITSADFTDSSLTAEGIKEWHLLHPHILRGMTELDFYKNRLDSTACNELATLIPFMPCLEYLNISSNPIGEGGSVQLITALSSCSRLSKLWMSRTGIGPADTEEIAKCLLLCDNVTMKELWLDQNDLPPESVGHILNALVKRRSVEKLELTYSKLSSVEMDTLASLLRHPENCALSLLHLKECGIDSSGVQEIATSLMVNESLHKLSLHRNSIGVEGAQSVAEAIQRNKTLKELSLIGNPLGEEGIWSLLIALEHNKTIKLKLPEKWKRMLVLENNKTIKFKLPEKEKILPEEVVSRVQWC